MYLGKVIERGLTVMRGYVAIVATQPPMAPATPSTTASDGIWARLGGLRRSGWGEDWNQDEIETSTRVRSKLPRLVLLFLEI